MEALLNAASAAPQRREHHLPRECYGRTDVAFSVTLCARHHGEPFRSPSLSTAVVEALLHRRQREIWFIYAFCLMPDHLHAVVQLRSGSERPKKDLLEVLAEFKSYTTRRAWREGLQGRLWQHDQYDSGLQTEREFRNRCFYVLNNPVRKGYVDDWTAWPWSGTPDEW